MTRLLLILALVGLFAWLTARALDVEHARAGMTGGTTGSPSKLVAQSNYLYQGKSARWWARRAVQARKDANARGRTIRRLKRELRRRWHPVDYAYRLASVAYEVPESELRSIGYCESKHHVFARNGQYRGVMQEGPMFERGPFGRAGFSVWDPVANVMTAAHARVEDGSWRQWECKP